MAIREATEADVGGIRSVAEAAWDADYPDILSRETAEAGVDDWYEPAHIEAELADPHTRVLVAERDGDVIGFAHLYIDDEVGHLLRLYVAPAVRREGIGRRLFEIACDELAELGVDRLTGMVLTANEPGNAFYRDLGFERVATEQTMIGGEAVDEHRYVFEIDGD